MCKCDFCGKAFRRKQVKWNHKVVCEKKQLRIIVEDLWSNAVFVKGDRMSKSIET